MTSDKLWSSGSVRLDWMITVSAVSFGRSPMLNSPDLLGQSLMQSSRRSASLQQLHSFGQWTGDLPVRAFTQLMSMNHSA